MAGGVEGVFVVAEEELAMPWDDAVADFMALDPAVFELRNRFVDQDALGVGHPKG
ncbi:hypothetical protein D3C87_1943020 [compost metagenome]